MCDELSKVQCLLQFGLQNPMQKNKNKKIDIPLTARFPFSEISNVLVASIRRTSNWTEPEIERQRNNNVNQHQSNSHCLMLTSCSSSLTSLWQDGGPMDGDIFKSYRGGFHDHPHISHQGAPR